MTARDEFVSSRPYDAGLNASAVEKSSIIDVFRFHDLRGNMIFYPTFYQLLFKRRTAITAGRNLGILDSSMENMFQTNKLLSLVHPSSVAAFVAGAVRVYQRSIPTLQSIVVEIRRVANDTPGSFFDEAQHLLNIKHALYTNQFVASFNIPRTGDKSMVWQAVKVPQVSIGDETSRKMSRVFFRKLASEVQSTNLAGTAYRKAAVAQFEQAVQSVSKRGLSSILDCNDLELAKSVFWQDLQNRGADRSRAIPIEDDVMYIAVSYRYEQKEGLSQEGWENVVQMLTSVGKRLGYDKIRIWVDRLAVTRGMTWSSVGFVPYLMFPTFMHPNAQRFTNRLWIELEKFASALGPGQLTPDITADDLMQHLVLTRSPIEALLAFAEVLVSGCLQGYEVTFEPDRREMVAWARSVLTTTLTTQILTTPRYDLEGRGETRHDMSMLCLFDDDIRRCDPVRQYIQHTEIRLGGDQGTWDGVTEIVGRTDLPNSEGVRSAVKEAAIVLYAPEFQSEESETICWHVLYTLRGKIITEVTVRVEDKISEAKVLCCSRVDPKETEDIDIRLSFMNRLRLTPRESPPQLSLMTRLRLAPPPGVTPGSFRSQISRSDGRVNIIPYGELMWS